MRILIAEDDRVSRPTLQGGGLKLTLLLALASCVADEQGRWE